MHRAISTFCRRHIDLQRIASALHPALPRL